MKILINYFDSSESFGMSGPWIGKLKVNNVELQNTFLDGNYLESEDDKYIAFNRFDAHESEKYFFGLLEKNYKRVFRILLFDSETQFWRISKNSWESLFLTRIVNNEIYFTNAFHDADRNLFPEKSIKIDSDNFEITSTP
jgi:hypothetical protein